MAIKTPGEVAIQVLDEHAIRPHFTRNREQIAKLIIEAIDIDRAQRDIEPKPDRYTGEDPRCKHCGKPVEPAISPVGDPDWKHTNGRWGCGNRHDTFAEV